MKNIILPVCLFVFTTIIIGCDSAGVRRKLVAADALIEDNPDSALSVLSSVMRSDISSDADMALFTLLDNQARYKLNRKASASELDFCVDYYTSHSNPRLLQRSYYYRAAINEEGDEASDVCIEDYKKAESLIDESRDNLMAARINEALCLINFNSLNADEALKFAKNELRYACMLNDTSFIVISFNNIAVAMSLKSRQDSAMSYIQKSLDISEKCDSSTKSTIYSNAANYYWEHLGDYESSERYYELALTYNKTDATVLALVRLLLAVDKKQQASHFIRQLINSSDSEIKMLAFDYLCQLCIENNDYKSAVDACIKSDSISDCINMYANEERIKEIQSKYDYEKISAEKKQELSKHIIILLLMVITFLSILVFVLIKIRAKEHRIRILEQQLEELDEQTEILKKDVEKNQNEKITAFLQIIKEKQKIISELDRKVYKVSSEGKKAKSTLQELADGLRSLYFVLQGEKNVLAEKHERENFIRCYTIIDEAFMQNLDKIDNITIGDKIYCILYRMEKNADEIQYALGVSNDAYRKAKSRLIKKLRTEKSMRRFCDNIE